MSRKSKRSLNDLKVALEAIPKNIDFGYCAVKSTETRQFTITNTTSGIVKYVIKKAEN